MAWLKLDHTFHGHAKIRKLGRVLQIPSAHAAGLAANLWAWAVSNAPDGDLSTIEPADIAYACMWDGDPDALVGALVACALVDNSNEIHNWHERQGSLKELSRKNKQRAQQRDAVTGQSRDNDGTVSGMSQARGDKRRGDKTRKEEKRKDLYKQRSVDQESAEAPTLAASVVSVVPVIESKESTNILAVFDYYRRTHPKSFPKPSSKLKEWAKIKALLSAGYSVNDICTAIEGCMTSPWHQGDNDRGRRYDALELIVRDSTKLEQFIALAHGPPPIVMSKSEKRLAETYRSFVGNSDALPPPQRLLDA